MYLYFDFNYFKMARKDSLLGSVDNSSSKALRPATCSRDPAILLTAQYYCTKLDRSRSREQVTGCSIVNCQQTLMTVLKMSKVAFFLLISACSADNKDLIQYIHEVKSRKSIPIKAIPAFSALSGFKFSNDVGRRNPLKPVGAKKYPDSFVLNQRRVRQALEDYYFSRCESNDEGECAR